MEIMGEKNNGILEKTSPNSPFIIHHSSFIIHHSSFITSSISTSPKFLRSPFFQTAKLLFLQPNSLKGIKLLRHTFFLVSETTSNMEKKFLT